MTLDRNLGPSGSNGAVLGNKEGRAGDPFVGFAIHLLFTPSAVALAGVAVFIRCKDEIELLLGDEIVVLFHAVFGNTDHLAARSGEFGLERGKVLGFGGAAGCVVLWIEIDNHLLAFESGQGDRLAAIGRKGEFRGHIALVRHSIAHGCRFPS